MSEWMDGGWRKHYANDKMTFTNGFNNKEDAYTISENIFISMYNYLNYVKHTHTPARKKKLEGNILKC